jgi:hypothetical protein
MHRSVCSLNFVKYSLRFNFPHAGNCPAASSLDIRHLLQFVFPRSPHSVHLAARNRTYAREDTSNSMGHVVRSGHQLLLAFASRLFVEHDLLAVYLELFCQSSNDALQCLACWTIRVRVEEALSVIASHAYPRIQRH